MASPSEFLTFYRRAIVRVPQVVRSSASLQSARPASRFLSSTARTSSEGKPTDKKHATTKAAEGDHLDVQSSNLKAADKAQKSGTGGTATSGSDSNSGKAQAKKDFPEAPDVAIGMQDERGGKGF